MKKFYLLSGILLTVLFSISLKAQGTWALQTNPLGSSDTAMIGQIRFDSSTEGWISGKGGTLLHTTNSGVNWTIVTPFPDDTVFSFSDPAFNLCFINQTTGWIVKSFGTGMNDSHGAVVYKTTDGGNNWERTVVSDSIGVLAAQLQFVDANNGWVSVLNAATRKGKLLRTTDGGENWTEANSLPASDEGDTFYFIDKNTGWMMTVNDHPSLFQISKTTDGGSTFNLQYSDNITNVDSTSNHGGMQFLDAAHGWAVGPNSRILKTTDGGANWKLLTTSGIEADANNRCLFFLDANTGWIGTAINSPDQPTNHFIIHTTDGGNSWTQENLPSKYEAVFSIYFLNQQEGWFTGDHGMIAHYNELTPVGSLNISLVPHNIQQITQNNRIWFVNEYGGYAWIANESSLIAKSKDLQNWEVLNNGIQQEGIGQLEFLNSDTIFAAGQSGSIYRTFDGGHNWTSVYNDTNVTNFIDKIKFFDNMNGIVMGDQASNATTMAFLNTTDGGKTWEKYNSSLIGTGSINEVDFISPSYVYLCGWNPINNINYQGIWKSSDRGKSWSFHSVGNTNKDFLTVVRAVMFKNSQMGFAAKEDSSLWMTEDGGNSWAKIYQAPSLINCLTKIDNSSIIYCLGQKGLTTEINTEPTITIKQEISDASKDFFYGSFVSENKGYLIDYNSSQDNFFTTFEGPAEINNNGTKVSSYMLYQNFPNPFNPTTTINYSVPKTSFVTLKVYDVLGNVIATLVNNEKAPGNYNIKFDGSKLASGIYFYRIEAGNFVQAKKLVLLK